MWRKTKAATRPQLRRIRPRLEALEDRSLPSNMADLALISANPPEPAIVGQASTYFLAVTNFGPDAATSVTVTDSVPSGVTLVSAAPSVGSFQQSGNVMTFSIGNL